MTSNLGADRIRQHTRQKESFEELKVDLMEILRGRFRPELINRIDEIIVFRARRCATTRAASSQWSRTTR